VASGGRRPPRRVGSALVNESDLKRLRLAWRTGDLVLFVGAGVSMPYGLPSWRNLVLELLFEQAQDTRRLGGMWPHYRRAVASWMADYFAYDPLVLARVVERHLRPGAPVEEADPQAPPDSKVFLERLRGHLYANLRQPTGRTALRAITELVKRPPRGGGVDAIVSFNFDDLLEHELEAAGVSFTSVFGAGRASGNGLRVIHAHGYVPRTGALSRGNIVFTEPDYHKLTESVFHWGLSEIVQRLRKCTVLFVGLSMSDPSLRRLLDASRNSKIPPHVQVQKRHEVRDHEMLDAMAEIDRRAKAHAQVIGTGVGEVKAPLELEEAVRAALKQADSYDREVFESMGVKTLWIDEFDQIPAIIDAIRR
jgi:hypothetical protein